MAVFWNVAQVIWWEFTDVSDVLATSIIALMTEAKRTSKMLEKFYQTTWHYIPEDGHLPK
jgi:hypothetical protein